MDALGRGAGCVQPPDRGVVDGRSHALNLVVDTLNMRSPAAGPKPA
jgi:hypothetical protein